MQLAKVYTPPSSLRVLAVGSDDAYQAVVELLLDKGLDAESKNHEGQTALHVAAGSGDERLTKTLLLARARIDARETNGATPLHLAVNWGHVRVVGLLLDSGADVEARDWQSNTPLMRVAGVGHLDVAKRLLAAGADATASRIHGVSQGVVTKSRAAVLMLDRANRGPSPRAGADGSDPSHAQAAFRRTTAEALPPSTRR